jgi:hypothetical protein
VRTLARDNEEERRVGLLLLGKGAVSAHRFDWPRVAGLDEREASPLPLGSLLLPKNAGVFLSVGSGLLAKEAQEAMGHADIRTTLNIYAKAVPGWQEQAAAKLDAYLDGATGLPAPDELRATVARQSRSETERSRAVPQRLRNAC